MSRIHVLQKKKKNKKEKAKTQTHKSQYPNRRVVLDKPPYIAKPNIIANQHIHSLTSKYLSISLMALFTLLTLFSFHFGLSLRGQIECSVSVVMGFMASPSHFLPFSCFLMVPPSQHIQVPKRIKGIIQMECKNFNNIKPNDSAWDQKKKKGDFF